MILTTFNKSSLALLISILSIERYIDAFTPNRRIIQSTIKPINHERRTQQHATLQMKRSERSTSSTIPKYVRIRQRGSKGLTSDGNKSRRQSQALEIQTAITSFENRKGQIVDIHSFLHFGAEDYYGYYSNDNSEFSSKYDRVHYELLIDESMLTTAFDDNGTPMSLKRYISPKSDGSHLLMAPASDTNTASQYGLLCQVNAVDYSKKDWIHADLTRQELLDEISQNQKQQQEQNTEGQGNGIMTELFKKNTNVNQDTPLWSLASTAASSSPIASWPGAEAISALFRPTTPSTSLSVPISRRLFSNLFLPGDALTGFLRSLFWIAIPSPELTVMILDWSSLIPRPTGGISKVALPVVECLFSGNIQAARQLVFGQMVVSGQSNSSSQEDVLIKKRNDKALSVLEMSLNRDGCNKNALLYGAMHCNDLHSKLIKLGFTPKKTVWRTAWSVNVPNFGTGIGSAGNIASTGSPLEMFFTDSSSPASIALSLVVLPLYLGIGGLDWISTLQDIATSIDKGHMADTTVVIGLYLLRHVLLYIGLSKFIIEWDSGEETNLFGGT